MILSGGLLRVNDAFIKAPQLDGMHAFEVVFFRNLFALISLMPLYAKLGVRRLLTRRPGLRVVRNVLQAVSMALWFRALEPVVFTRLIWAAAIGYFGFGEFPGLWSWIGAALIIFGAALLLRAEARGGGGSSRG